MINLKSMPFDSQLDGGTYDRAISAAEFARYLSSFVTNGVIVAGENILNTELEVTAAGALDVSINKGAIHINGRVGWRDSSFETLTLDAGGSNPRIDRIVAEMNASVGTRAIVLKVVKGVEDANPIPPSLIQTEEVYQLSLAQVNINAGTSTIASIIDERGNPDVCGLANMFVGTTGYEADYVMLDLVNIANYDMGAEVPSDQNVQFALKKNKEFLDNIWAEIMDIVNGTIVVAKATDSDTLDEQHGSYYLSRANHTGTQLSSTISNFASSVRDTVLTGLSTALGTVISSSDSILAALGKLQKQITTNKGTADSHIGSTGSSHGIATTSVNGFMSSTDKFKLNGIEAGAEANDVTSVAGKTGAVTVTKSDVGLSNVDDVKQMPISDGVLENYREKLVTLTGTSTTINLSLGNVFTHTLSGNTTYTITNAVNGVAHSFTLIFTQPITPVTVSFPASVKWQGGTAPTMNVAEKTYLFTFLTIDGGTTWLGIPGGEF